MRIERIDMQINNLQLKIHSMPVPAPPLVQEMQSLQSSARAAESLAAQNPAAAAQSLDSLEQRAADDEHKVEPSPTPNPRGHDGPDPGEATPTPDPDTSGAPPPTLAIDRDFPNPKPCVGAAHDSTETESTATRPTLMVIKEVAESLTMAGIGTISELPGVEELTLVNDVADVARETAAYGVDAATKDLTAHLLTMKKETADLHRFFEAEHRHPKGSPEYEKLKQQYVHVLRKHLVEENAAVPHGETWAFITSAVTSSPEILMHERKMLAEGASKIVVGLFLGKAAEKAGLDPEHVLPEEVLQRVKGMGQRADRAFSANAWKNFDSLKGGQKFVAALLEDMTKKAVVSTVFDRDGQPARLYQYQHSDCVDASVVAYVKPPWANLPIRSVIFAPEVVQNAPPIQVVQLAAAPLAPQAAAVETPSPAPPAASPPQTRPLENNWNDTRSSSGSDTSTSHHVPACEALLDCRAAIQLSNHPTMAGHMFDGSR